MDGGKSCVRIGVRLWVRVEESGFGVNVGVG